MNLLTLIAKDARVLSRNRVILAALILYPLLLVGVLGAAFADTPISLSVAIANNDAGALPVKVGDRELSGARMVDAAREFADVRDVSTEAGMDLVQQGEVDALVIIPPGFTNAFRGTALRTNLTIVVDESDPVRASVSRNAVAGALRSLLDDVVDYKIALVEDSIRDAIEGRDIGNLRLLGLNRTIEVLSEIRDSGEVKDPQAAADLRDAITFLITVRGVLGQSADILVGAALPVTLQTRGIVAEPLGILDVILPGAIVLSVFWGGTLATAVLWTQELESRALTRLRASPVSLATVALSKGLLALLIVTLQAGILLAIGVGVWDVTVTDWSLTFIAIIAAGIAAVGLGSLAASTAPGTSSAALLAVLALFPMMFLAGLFFPTSHLPGIARAVSLTLPMTHAVDALRAGMLRAADAGDAWLPLAALVVTAAILGGLAVAVARTREAWRP